MGKIQLLDKAVAELIAAGEVVERPASIVKELLENAVDAGATQISVEIRGGGIAYIRVSDNGSGIPAEEIPTAFLRHATSKLRRAEDLEGIATMGFRGEALASIAAMSRVEMTTRTAGEEEGTVYRMEGGVFQSGEPAGCPVGTSIVVRDVFYNTPARMKFLKKDVAEGNAIAQAVDRLAMAHPEIAFRFIRDGQTRLTTSGGGDLRAVMAAVYSREFVKDLLPVGYAHENGIRVTGLVSTPAGAKPSRGYQTFYINRRYVRTRTCAAAVEEAFKTLMPAGRFPACVLNLEIGAGSVDVNVHPAKIEVRFVDERPIFQAVYYAVKTALNRLENPLSAQGIQVRAGGEDNDRPVPQKPEPSGQQRMSAGQFREIFRFGSKEDSLWKKPVSLGASRLDIAVEEEPVSAAAPVIPNRSPYSDKISHPPRDTIFGEDAAKPTEKTTFNMTEQTEEVLGNPASPEPLRLIGELFGTYILLESAEAFLLVDKHAAHERICYERLKSGVDAGESQILLTPQAVTMNKRDYAATLENLEALSKVGFAVEDFGDGTVMVREVPIELQQQDIGYILLEVVDKLRRGSGDLTPAALDRIYYSIACKSAVRGGEKSSPEELRELVRRLEENPQVTHCPHGRPVTVALSKYEVEKMFGRQG